MNTKFLTGLVATTAAIATAFMGGTAEASNLKTSDPAFYDLLVNEYLLKSGGEGQALANYANYALNGNITALGSSVDVFFVDTSLASQSYALYENRITYNVNDGATQQAFNADGTNRVDNSLQQVAHGEGFSIGTTAGDILDFSLWTKEWGGKNLYYGADASANLDGLQHIVSYEVQYDGFNWLYLGWEDISGGGDLDFNDAGIVLKGVAVSKDVPEPGVTLALLGVAAGTMGLRRRKNAA